MEKELRDAKDLSGVNVHSQEEKDQWLELRASRCRQDYSDWTQ